MYHQVYNHEELTREFMEFVHKQTDMNVITCTEAMTGEDFGYMLRNPWIYVLAWSKFRIWFTSCKIKTRLKK